MLVVESIEYISILKQYDELRKFLTSHHQAKKGVSIMTKFVSPARSMSLFCTITIIFVRAF